MCKFFANIFAVILIPLQRRPYIFEHKILVCGHKNVISTVNGCFELKGRCTFYILNNKQGIYQFLHAIIY